MYKKDLLREYVQNSDLRIFKDTLYVRLSEGLAKNYDDGLYNNYLNCMYDSYQQLLSLNLKLPCNGIPNLYIYIVPDNNYSELLSYPTKYNKGTGGGRPVKCYDLDGYIQAYGISQNLCINYSENPVIAKVENNIHELTHVTCGQFAYKGSSFGEGFAEVLPLYILDYEKSFTEHKNAILSLRQDDIFTVSELFASEKDNSFGVTSIYPNKTCSFRYSYISSYLFIRGLLETITKTKELSKIGALQYCLEFLKNSSYSHEWLMVDICNDLGLDSDEILNGKTLQNNAILSIKEDL